MSQCERILDVLVDGEWHSVHEIHDRAGYSRLNSRVSELRSRGHVIECDQAGEGERATDRFRYRLVGLGERGGQARAGDRLTGTQEPTPCSPSSIFAESESGQLLLVAA